MCSSDLPVLAGVVKAHLRPAFHRQLQVVFVRREIDRVVVDVARHVDSELAFELLAHTVVRKGQPACGVDVGVVVDGVDVVFALQALRNHFELQLADGAEQQRIARARIEDLDRAFMVMGYLFCLCSAFVLSKFVRDRESRPEADTPMWGWVVRGGFAMAMGLTAWGLWRMQEIGRAHV